MYPLSTAASAFKIEDPAAPITAKRTVSTKFLDAKDGRGELTIVAESHKLDVKDTTLVLPNSANTHGISLGEIPVKSRLGSVGLVEDLEGRVRRRRAAQLLGLGDIAAHGLLDLLRGGRWALGETKRHTSGVAI